ncbi:MAG: CdaR family protein [Bacteroidota bacterium]|nr:CdaR family protein [Bacteroidota bacterium]MDP4229743.1 CdaR family protein [Bacteroidota bacterium]MDP4235877.1 CdaR family protein [Bacteroidota bacterium]
MGLARRIGVGAAAIFFALLLWTYVHLSSNYEVDMDLPLEITSPTGFAVATELPERIHARFSGIGWRLMLMNFTPKSRFKLDLTERDTKDLATGKFFITKEDLATSTTLPSDVKLIKIVPDSLGIKFSREMTKRIPIELRLDVTPASGYTIVGDPLIAPVFVNVKGSSIILDSLRSFPTKVLKAHNMRETFTRTLEISDTLKDEITSVSANAITVRIGIEAIAERTFKDIPLAVEALSFDRDLLLDPGSVSVILRGGVDQLAKLDPLAIHAKVVYDATRFDSLSAVKPVIDAPKGIEILSIDPPEVKFVVRRK